MTTRRALFACLACAGAAGHGAFRATPAQAQATAAGPAPIAPSRWGAADQLGNANLLTPQKVQEATRLVTTGKTYRMGIPVDRTTPAFPPRSVGVTVLMPGQEDGQTFGRNRASYVDDMITGWNGVGTQLDGLGHLGVDHTFYGGRRARDFVRVTGVEALGIEGIPPIVTRGVLIDCARAKGKPRLEGGELVTADELRAAMAAQNVRVTPGDVIVLHTGWLDLLTTDPRRFGSEEPGIDGRGAEYLASLEPVAVGADTWGVEAVPFPVPDVNWEGHQIFLARHGIYILENLDTRALVRDGVQEFLFVLGQPLLKGAVQAIINPIAIR